MIPIELLKRVDKVICSGSADAIAAAIVMRDALLMLDVEPEMHQIPYASLEHHAIGVVSSGLTVLLDMAPLLPKPPEDRARQRRLLEEAKDHFIVIETGHEMDDIPAIYGDRGFFSMDESTTKLVFDLAWQPAYAQTKYEREPEKVAAFVAAIQAHEGVGDDDHHDAIELGSAVATMLTALGTRFWFGNAMRGRAYLNDQDIAHGKLLARSQLERVAEASHQMVMTSLTNGEDTIVLATFQENNIGTPIAFDLAELLRDSPLDSKPRAALLAAFRYTLPDGDRRPVLLFSVMLIEGKFDCVGLAEMCGGQGTENMCTFTLKPTPLDPFKVIVLLLERFLKQEDEKKHASGKAGND